MWHGRRRRGAPGQIHSRRAAAASVGRCFHGAAATAVAMDLGPPSSVGGREVGKEGGDKQRRGGLGWGRRKARCGGGGRGRGEARCGGGGWGRDWGRGSMLGLSFIRVKV